MGGIVHLPPFGIPKRDRTPPIPSRYCVKMMGIGPAGCFFWNKQTPPKLTRLAGKSTIWLHVPCISYWKWWYFPIENGGFSWIFQHVMVGFQVSPRFPRGFPSTSPFVKSRTSSLEDFGAKPTMDLGWTCDANALFEGEGLDDRLPVCYTPVIQHSNGNSPFPIGNSWKQMVVTNLYRFVTYFFPTIFFSTWFGIFFPVSFFFKCFWFRTFLLKHFFEFYPDPWERWFSVTHIFSYFLNWVTRSREKTRVKRDGIKNMHEN